MININSLFSLLFLGLIICAQLVHGSSVCSERGGNQYMCVDWSVGSERMSIAQYHHKKESGENVIFGVGSYGAQWNYNIGKCYKFYTKPASRPIIAQVTNYGADIQSNQFDIQTGGGGFGVWNACSARTDRTSSHSDPCRSSLINIPVLPQFPGWKGRWGRRCGGPSYRFQCNSLPRYPVPLHGRPPKRPKWYYKKDEPDLQTLCKRSFDWGVRINNNIKKIERGHRVPCPTPLIRITNLKRSDDAHYENMAPGKLTTTMDCCAPASAYPSIMHGNNLMAPFNRIHPCRRDGYTRFP